jgi:hypothetical protein
VPGGCHLQPGRLCRLLLALDALLRRGQVGGLLGGFACQRVALSGQRGHLLGQLVALGLQRLASGGQLGGLRLRLHQTALDLAACPRCGPLDFGGNGSGQRLRQFRRSGGGHRASLTPRGQMLVKVFGLPVSPNRSRTARMVGC